MIAMEATDERVERVSTLNKQSNKKKTGWRDRQTDVGRESDREKWYQQIYATNCMPNFMQKWKQLKCSLLSCICLHCLWLCQF